MLKTRGSIELPCSNSIRSTPRRDGRRNALTAPLWGTAYPRDGCARATRGLTTRFLSLEQDRPGRWLHICLGLEHKPAFTERAMPKAYPTGPIPPFPPEINRVAFGNWLSGLTDGEGCFFLGLVR